MPSLEVDELVRRADAFLEEAPGQVLRRWRAHRAKLRYQVAVPDGLEAPLRPLFLRRAFAEDVALASAPGEPPPEVVMPSAVGTAGAFHLTEPPHGREWLLYAAYLDVMRAPWLDALALGFEVPGAVEQLADFFRARTGEGALALAFSDADVAQVHSSGARVLQCAWRLEAQLAAQGVAVRTVDTSGLLRDDEGQLRFTSDGAPVGAVAWWSTPEVDVSEYGVPSWPAPGAHDAVWLGRRALPRLSSAAHSRYAQSTPPPRAGEGLVFKPFDDAYAEVEASHAQPGAGVLQAKVALPRTRLPFELGGVVSWRDCGVEVGVLALGGRVVTAFGRCVVDTADGPVDLVCPAVLVP